MFQMLQNCSSQTKQLSITVFTQRTIEQTVRPPCQINSGGDKGREADGPVRASTGAPVLHDLWPWLQTLPPEPGKQEVQEKHGWSKQGPERSKSGANGIECAHAAFECKVFAMFRNDLTAGDVSEDKLQWANKYRNACKHISKEFGCVWNLPWALSQHVLWLKYTHTHMHTHHCSGSDLSPLSQYKGGWQALVWWEKNGRITGGETLPLAAFSTQKDPQVNTGSAPKHGHVHRHTRPQYTQTNTLVLKGQTHAHTCAHRAGCKAIICSTLSQCRTQQPSLLWVHLSLFPSFHLTLLLLLFSPST